MAKPGERFKTYQNVFDEFTNRNVFKLITEGFFKGMESPVSVGKESNVFSAITNDNKRVIVKIYRLETCNFNRMYDYIRADPRFPHLKKRRRDIIFAWAKREYRNLLKAREANVKVPTPLTFKFNILVLEFIGDDKAAPRLKAMPPSDPKSFCDEVIMNMKRLYSAGLVHADLSPFNILNYRDSPVFIDFSQATTFDNPNSAAYLERDIRNVAAYFSKLGLKLDEQEIKRRIIG